MRYFIPNGSLYLEIVRIKYQCDDYVRAHVRWYSRPGNTFLIENRNLKIPTKAKANWKWNEEEDDSGESLQEV